MTRKVSIRQGRPAVSHIWAYYKYIRDRLDKDWNLALSIGRGGFATLPDELRGLQTDEAFRLLIGELEDEVTMALVSSFEACLRIDFLERVYNKKRDKVSRAFREIYASRRDRGPRVPLEELLNTWRDVGEIGYALVGAVKQLFDYRNWLAHGGYWVFKSRKYDPEEALAEAENLFGVLETHYGFTHYRQEIG